MITVTKITQSRKVQDRYYVELDSGETLTVSVAQIADHSLYTGRELSEEEYSKLKDDSARSSSKVRALRILGSRNMSRKEIVRRMIEKGDDEATANDTAEWLERVGALNDEEYADMIVRHYSAKGYGTARIREELYRRGIEKELWEAALKQYDGGEVLDRLIESRLKGTDCGRNEIKKVSDALYRRGYSWDEIRTALEKYSSRLEDCD